MKLFLDASLSSSTGWNQFKSTLVHIILTLLLNELILNHKVLRLWSMTPCRFSLTFHLHNFSLKIYIFRLYQSLSETEAEGSRKEEDLILSTAFLWRHNHLKYTMSRKYRNTLKVLFSFSFVFPIIPIK